MGEVEKRCGSCSRKLRKIKRANIQLGEYGGLLGRWSNLVEGALEVEIWSCPACGKLEFYQPCFEPDEEDEGECEEGHMAQTMCPNCGRSHDLDDPKCPFCGAKNLNIANSHEEKYYGIF